MKILLRRAAPIMMLCMVLALAACTQTNAADAPIASERETQSGPLTGSLKVAALRDIEYLNFAANRFMEVNEGVSVEVINYDTRMEDKDYVDRYFQIISTALMSGIGEDILDTAFISWTKLVDRDKLVDLNEYINFDPSVYYMSVLDAFLYKGGRYTLPITFAMNNICEYWETVADNETPSDITLNDLAELAKKYPGTTLLSNTSSYPSIAYKFYQLGFNDFVDIASKKANFDDGRFASLLETVKTIEAGVESDEGNYLSSNYVISEETIMSPVMSNMGTQDYSNKFLITNEEGRRLFFTNNFKPAINANSTNKELAAAFVEFIISEEIQTSPELYTAPVNRAACAEASRLVYQSVTADGYTPEGFDLEKNIELFNGMVEKLTDYESNDKFINEFVSDEINRFFEGEQTAEQAAANAQFRVNTYLNE